MKRFIFGLAAAAAFAAAPALAQNLYDAGGFEGFALGDLPGQFGWVADNADGDDGGTPVPYPPVQVVADPTGAGRGNVLEFNPGGTFGGWQGAAVGYGPNTEPIVTVQWDQWRADTNDNVWLADAIAFDGWWSIQWDTNASIHTVGFSDGLALTTGVWQTIQYTFDFDADTVTLSVDGTTGPTVAGINRAFQDGFVFEYEPGAFAGAGGPFLVDDFMVTQVPEPAAALLLAMGTALLRRR